MIGTMLSDPVFQMGSFGVVVGTIAVLLALRAQVGNHPVAVARGTRMVLALAILGILLVSGWSGWSALVVPKGNASASSPISSISPTPSPTAPPTPEPTPSPTPHLARSITQVLTTFCAEISARNYLAAWSMYATSLQSRHSYTAVRTAWSQYTACSVADQAGDPDAISVLTFTLAPGVMDQYGFTGDTYLQFTMGIEAQAWKITAVCHQIAESCFDLVWG